ncbi:uncharacterized protein LOC144425906 [Styela clava]
MWNTATCLPEGFHYPEKLPSDRLEEMDNMNIRKLTHLFNSTKSSADNGNVGNQTNCFGIEYPLHCTKYYGPHPLDCLITIWDSARCLIEGHKHPNKISDEELDRHNNMNLRELADEFNATKSNADNSDIPSQFLCFGLEYPSGCNLYYGPYSVSCLETIWISVKCLPEGSEFPTKLTVQKIDSFNGMGLRFVTSFLLSLIFQMFGNFFIVILHLMTYFKALLSVSSRCTASGFLQTNTIFLKFITTRLRVYDLIYTIQYFCCILSVFI